MKKAISFLVAVLVASAFSAVPACLAADGSAPGTPDAADGPAGASVKAAGAVSGEDCGDERYVYRLLIGTGDDGGSCALCGGKLLGAYGDAALVGFDNALQMEIARVQLLSRCPFVTVDGCIGASSGSGLESVESASGSDAVGAGDNAIANLSRVELQLPPEADIAFVDTGMAGGGNVVSRISVIGQEPGDDCGHGSAMLAAALSENPDAQVASIKALDAAGRGSVSSVYAGIIAAANSGARVVNLSFSAFAPRGCAAIEHAVEYASAKGCMVVSSAGNASADAACYCPAGIAAAFTVGACDGRGVLAGASNYGKSVDMYAVADSTSEAAARLSGWASAHEVRDAAETGRFFLEAGRAPSDGGAVSEPDRGDGALVFSANAYTVKPSGAFYLSLKQGSTEIGKCKVSVTGGSANLGDWAASRTLSLSVTNTKGSYFSVGSSTTKTSIKYADVNGNVEKTGDKYYPWATFHLKVKVPGGWHGDGWSNDSDYGIFRQWKCTGNNGVYYATGTTGNACGIQSNSDASRDLYVSMYLGNCGMFSNKTPVNATGIVTLARNTYSVSYKPNGGSSTPSAQVKQYGVALKLRDKIAHAKTTPATYTVKYDSNGGTSCPSATSTVTRSWTFAGWSSSSDGKTYEAGGAYSANAASTMTAKWTTADSNPAVTLPSPTKAGHAFAGWYNGSAKVGGAGSSYKPSASVTLTAKWTANTYTVSYNANGGTPTPAAQTKTYGANLALASAISHASTTPATYTVSYDSAGGTGCASASSAVVRTWTFSGWKSSSDGKVYGAGGAYATNAASTMTAQWTTRDSNPAITLPSPTRAGYTFAGWYCGAARVGGSGGSYTPSGNVALTAHWEPVQVRFSVPTNIGYAALSDGTLVGPEGGFRIENLSGVGIVVDSLLVEDGQCRIVESPVQANEVSLDIAVAGHPVLSLGDYKGDAFKDIPDGGWKIAADGSLEIECKPGRMARCDELKSTGATVMGTMHWRVSPDL